MISYEKTLQELELEEDKTTAWIESVINKEGFILGEISYTFCTDEELYKLNMEFLNHDTYTDIISFDYSVGKILQGDIYISIDRVRENAKIFKVEFAEELSRVLIHGVLHFCGYKDKTEIEKKLMRNKEDYYLSNK